MDQTGIHLVPAAQYTYEKSGASSVAVIGAEDKRQITACIASSLDGNLLPLQLIFTGKTPRSLPTATPLSLSASVHITNSENHWSSQATMQEYVQNVILPYAERMTKLYNLDSNCKILLVLDVWAVHKSVEFREFLHKFHPRVRLVFVPANCTSKLQVADVALQRPFKHGVKKRYEQWMAEEMFKQLKEDKLVGVHDLLLMSTIKPRVLQWCVESWLDLKDRKQLILDGWEKCTLHFYNVHEHDKQLEALREVHSNRLNPEFVPEETEDEHGAEQESDLESEDDGEGYEGESDSDGGELDTAKPINQGVRRSARPIRPPQKLHLGIDTQYMDFSGESEAEK
jgi:hypothetical protein